MKVFTILARAILPFTNCYPFLCSDSQKCSHNRGASSIALVFSSLAGFVFLMLLIDLANYVRVNGAIQDSLATAMRCIVPSEGACLNPDSAASGQQVSDWYGFPARPTTAISYAQEVSYAPTINETSWRANVASYNVPEFEVSAAWNQYDIPVSRFVARLNSWSDTWAPVNRVWFVYGEDGEVLSDGKFSHRLTGPLMNLPHFIGRGKHYSTAGSVQAHENKPGPFTTESWCPPGVHTTTFQDFNANGKPDDLDTYLRKKEDQNVTVLSSCEIEKDNHEWVTLSNCDWEGKETNDPHSTFGTNESVHYNGRTATPYGFEEAHRGEFKTFRTEGIPYDLQVVPDNHLLPHNITTEAQYLVVEVVGCADGVLDYLNTKALSMEDISNLFQISDSGPKMNQDWRESLVQSGHLPPGSETIVPTGSILDASQNPNAGLISTAAWTYLQMDLEDTKGNKLSISRGICEPNWVEVTPELANNKLFSELFDKSYTERTAAGRKFTGLPKPLRVNYTDLSCSTKVENPVTHTCEKSQIGCEETTMADSCPNLEKSFLELSDTVDVAKINTSSQTGLGSSFLDKFADKLIPKDTIIEEDPRKFGELLFEKTILENVQALETLGCKESTPAESLELVLRGDGLSGCLENQEATLQEVPSEEKWQTALKQNYPNIFGSIPKIGESASIQTNPRQLEVKDPRAIPQGLRGAPLVAQTNSTPSCLERSECQNPNSFLTEKEQLQALIAKQYGSSYQNCSLTDLGKTDSGVLHLVENPQSVDACVPLLTNCVDPTSDPSSTPTLIARAASQPSSCDSESSESTSFIGCYAVPVSETFSEEESSDTNLNIELAKDIGFTTLKKIVNNATNDSSGCSSKIDCGSIALEVSSSGQATGSITYNMKLGPVMTAILGQNFLSLSHSKSETLEIVRQGRMLNVATNSGS